MKHLLVIRFKAMGDVALALPVLQSVLQQNKDLQITFLSKKSFSPFFEGVDRLHFYGADFSSNHRGITGIFRLFREITSTTQFDAVIDLHDVLRSWLLNSFFRVSGTPVYQMDKGRKEKKALTRQQNKIRKPLPHTTERYLEVFASAGYAADLSDSPWYNRTSSIQQYLGQEHITDKKEPWVGFAPFAMHLQKMWPLEKSEEAIRLLSDKGCRIFLFGGGAGEIKKLSAISTENKNTHLVAGQLGLAEELTLMRQLDVMVTMDSSNMHMATLTGTPVVSIWGATHPYAGFGPLGKNENNIIEVPLEELTCRPCSVFGNKPCFRGDIACLAWITPAQIIKKIDDVLKPVG